MIPQYASSYLNEARNIALPLEMSLLSNLDLPVFVSPPSVS